MKRRPFRSGGEKTSYFFPPPRKKEDKEGKGALVYFLLLPLPLFATVAAAPSFRPTIFSRRTPLLVPP